MRIPLPKLVEVIQTYPSSPRLDFPSLIEEQFHYQGISRRISPGMRIAVGVGSRGITNLKEIVKATVGVLTAAGTRPFIIPAMGSHGGATSEGQINVLAEYGITPESIGVPIEASMEVGAIGKARNRFDVVFSASALRADAVVAINRIKPHTDFRGALGSGIQKMLTIGFGKQIGAANAHRFAAQVGHETMIHEFAKIILQNVRVLCGIAILEDQNHQTAELKVLSPDVIPSEELVLFKRAQSLMPRLPLDEIDLLIVDQIGKEISGTGMDTNIIGRDIVGYSTSFQDSSQVRPRILRIFVRDLSPATNGNGIGIGLADFTTDRAVRALDLRAVYMNATTSMGLQPAKIPIHFATDREAIQEALGTIVPADPQMVRVVRIVNTLSLERMLASECCCELLRKQPGVSLTGQAQTMQFDDVDNLLPF